MIVMCVLDVGSCFCLVVRLVVLVYMVGWEWSFLCMCVLGSDLVMEWFFE